MDVKTTYSTSMIEALWLRAALKSSSVLLEKKQRSDNAG